MNSSLYTHAELSYEDKVLKYYLYRVKRDYPRMSRPQQNQLARSMAEKEIREEAERPVQWSMI